MGRSRALDVGAGIGRVTKHVLEPRFAAIDLLDPSFSLLSQAKSFINSPKVEEALCVGLQDFKFTRMYDCIWVQWVWCYLTDTDLLAFFAQAKQHLSAGGMIFAKENVHDTGFYVDKDDNSVVRSDTLYLELFQEAGFEVLKHMYQPGFPDDLYNISFWALRPKQQ